MANEAAAHREYAEKLAWKSVNMWRKRKVFSLQPAVSFCIDEAVRTALEKAAHAVMPDDFDKGSSEWCALCAVQASIRSIVLRADDVREEG